MAISTAIFRGALDVTAYGVAEAKNTLSKLIDRALRGEEVVIARHGKPVAELEPSGRRRPLRLMLGCDHGDARGPGSA